MPSSLERQWQLLLALTARQAGVPLSELAREHEVAERTIRRDLLLLRKVGFPVAEERTDHGKKLWRVSDDRRSPPLPFSWDEAIALYLAGRFLEPFAGTYVWTAAQRAFRGLRTAAPLTPPRRRRHGPAGCPFGARCDRQDTSYRRLDGRPPTSVPALIPAA